MDKHGKLAKIANKICLPLFTTFPVDFFAYMEIQDNGLIKTINTDSQFYKSLINLSYTDLFFRVSKQINGFHQDKYLSDLSSNPSLKGTLFEKFEYKHLLFMIETEKTHRRFSTTKVFIYGARPGKKEVSQFYINHFPFLQNFNHYFQSQFSIHKNNLKIESIADNKKELFKRIMKSSQEQQNDGKVKIDNFNSRYLLEKGLRFHITHQEWQVISWYLRGKTSEETAIILDMSLRTVEYHFAELRKKLQCASKAQIVAKLLEEERESIFKLMS